MPSTIVLTLPDAVTDPTGLSSLPTDALLDSDPNEGVLWLVDASRTASWDGTAPTHAAVVQDISVHGRDSSWTIQTGQSVGFAGGGFDFSLIDAAAATAENNYLAIPASVSAALWDGGTGLQRFLLCLYLRLPSSANWNSSAGIAPIVQWSGAGYNAEPDFLTISQVAAGQILSFRRQTSVGNVSELVITPAVGDYGSLVQLAYWRDATGTKARLKSANGTIQSSGAAGSANAANFAATVGRLGVSSAFWSLPAETGQRNATKFRLFRGWMEDLDTSGRDAVTVLDADYTRTVARAVFS